LRTGAGDYNLFGKYLAIHGNNRAAALRYSVITFVLEKGQTMCDELRALL
jgi:hypothetical protein